MCGANIARSQMAEAFARLRGLEAKSAGLEVGANNKIEEYPAFVQCMGEVGYIGLGDHRRKQLTPELINWADRVVVMVEEPWPDYLLAARDKILARETRDPNHCTYRVICSIRDDIEKMVEGLEK